jgi:uncharacterized protein (UPF0248 family)
LSRIRWDSDFGAANFTIGYYDRVEHGVISVALKEIQIEPGNHFSFAVTDPYGTLHDVPYHRVREVHRNGELIWHRTVPGEPTGQ